MRPRQSRDQLEAAIKAAKIFFVPVDDGGLAFQTGVDVWFEELPLHRGPRYHASPNILVVEQTLSV